MNKISTNRPRSTKISSGRQKKEKIIAELVEKVNKAKALVFTNYQGMTHQQMEGLKKSLRKADAELVVAKNTLLARTKIGDLKTEVEEYLKNPTATIFAYSDVVLPLKELSKTIKTLKLPEIKFGILSSEARSGFARDMKFLTAEDIIKLSTLPSREVLIAQVVGGMKSPLYGLHRALNWNITKLVLTLQAVQKSKTS